MRLYYFMPAWANEDSNMWENNTSPWYWASKKKFDDTVSQLKMFKQSKQTELLLSYRYSPFLRSFLTQEELYEVDYYNVFDDIQDVQNIETRNFDFKDLDWPNEIEFYYTPFIVVARLNGQLWGRIEFSKEGKVLKIICFKPSAKVTYFFDDRGFTSSIETESSNKNQHVQYFLNAYGQWRVCLDVRTGEVRVNPKFAADFESNKYASFSDLQAEKLGKFLKNNFDKNDMLVVAGANYQTKFLAKLKIPTSQVVFSIFAQRIKLSYETVQEFLKYGKYFIADTDRHLQLLKEYLSAQHSSNVLRLTPFDTRLRLGHSQQEKKLKTFWLLDGLTDVEIQNYFNEILAVMKTNKLVDLVIASNNDWEQQRLTEVFLPIIDKQEMLNEVSFNFLEQDNEIEDSLDNKIILPPKRLIRFVKVYSEETYLEELDDTRIILDLSEEPNLYLQIAGISAGIPQINQFANSYVKNNQNGLILNSKLRLRNAMEYYLASLAHWNQALVYATAQISKYSGTNLVDKWNLFLKKEAANE